MFNDHDISSGVVISEESTALRQGQRCMQQTYERCRNELGLWSPATLRAESEGKAYVKC